MELRWLDDFVALARLQHFSRAAEERHVTQPTFSRRIKLLEEAVGATLIDRHTLPLSLTPAGEKFLQSAMQVSQTLRDTCRDCQIYEQQAANRLVFATTQILYLSTYKTWLEPLALRHDLDLQLNLQSTSWSAIDFVESLQQGSCDLVLCYWHPQIEHLKTLTDEGFSHWQVAEEMLLPVSVADSQGKPRFSLPGARQRPLPYIAYHTSSFMSALLRRQLADRTEAAHLSVLNENRHAVSVAAMIREGFGLGWVPQRLVQNDLDAGRLVLAGTERWFIPLQVRLYHGKHAKNGEIERLWQALAEPEKKTA